MAFGVEETEFFQGSIAQQQSRAVFFGWLLFSGASKFVLWQELYEL